MDRKVTATKKDRDGNIIALCNRGQSWSPRRIADVIKDILNNKRSYYVHEADRRSYVRVISGNALQTTSDVTSSNSLHKLPDA